MGIINGEHLTTWRYNTVKVILQLIITSLEYFNYPISCFRLGTSTGRQVTWWFNLAMKRTSSSSVSRQNAKFFTNLLEATSSFRWGAKTAIRYLTRSSFINWLGVGRECFKIFLFFFVFTFYNITTTCCISPTRDCRNIKYHVSAYCNYNDLAFISLNFYIVALMLIITLMYNIFI